MNAIPTHRMSKGRGFGIYTKGEQITNISQLHVGDLLLEHSIQFDADNTILITHEFEGRVWAHFVDPTDWTQRWGEDFCIWHWDFDGSMSHINSQLWRAVPRKRKDVV